MLSSKNNIVRPQEKKTKLSCDAHFLVYALAQFSMCKLQCAMCQSLDDMSQTSRQQKEHR